METNRYQIASDLRELDHRYHDRVDVRLLWRARDNQVLVVVTDDRTGERMVLDVGASERALDVFHHPFAYAGWRGITTGSEPLEQGARLEP